MNIERMEIDFTFVCMAANHSSSFGTTIPVV